MSEPARLGLVSLLDGMVRNRDLTPDRLAVVLNNDGMRPAEIDPADVAPAKEQG